MKKMLLITTLFVGVAAFSGKAQLQKGNVLIGSDISNFNIGLNKGSYFTMLIDPKAAWFVKDNTALGGYVKLGLATAKGQGTTFTYGFGGLGRQYFSGDALSALRHTRLFVEGNLGIEGENFSASNINSSTNGLGFGFGPGVAYFVTPNVGLEGLVKYNAIVGFGNSTTTSNLNFGIGLQIYLPNKTVKNAMMNKQ